MNLETVDGYTIGVYKNTFITTRKTIVFIHGIGVSSRYYIPLAKELDNDYNVILLDLPGYGKTPRPKKALTIAQLTQVVNSYLKKHTLTSVTVVGHSMGCQIITHLARIAAHAVNRIILISPTVNKNERTIVMQALRLTQNSFLEKPEVNKIIFSDYLRMGVVRYLHTSRLMTADHIEKTLAENSTPALIIRGGYDPIVPENWVQYLASLKPYYSMAVVPKAPHAFQYFHAKQTAELCRLFIEK